MREATRQAACCYLRREFPCFPRHRFSSTYSMTVTRSTVLCLSGEVGFTFSANHPERGRSPQPFHKTLVKLERCTETGPARRNPPCGRLPADGTWLGTGRLETPSRDR